MSWQVRGAPRPPFGWAEPPRIVVLEDGDERHEACVYVPDTEVRALRELVVALYHIHFGTEEESWDAWEDFCPCGICQERHGGEAPCAYTAKDLADECCEPITKEIVIDRMRELGVKVNA